MRAPSEPVSTERYSSAATTPLAIAAASGMLSSALSVRLSQDVRQEREEPRALDRLGELTLLAGRHRGDPARHDLAAFGDEPLQQLDVLVVDLGRARPGERAGFAAAEEWTPCATAPAAHAARSARIASGITMVAHASTPSTTTGASRGGPSRGSSRSRPSSRRSPPSERRGRSSLLPRD